MIRSLPRPAATVLSWKRVSQPRWKTARASGVAAGSLASGQRLRIVELAVGEQAAGAQVIEEGQDGTLGGHRQLRGAIGLRNPAPRF